MPNRFTPPMLDENKARAIAGFPIDVALACVCDLQSRDLCELALKEERRLLGRSAIQLALSRRMTVIRERGEPF